MAMRALYLRFSGLFLLLIALGPLVIAVACFVAAAVEAAGATKLVIQRAEPILRTVQTQIVPVAQHIEMQAAELGNALTAARDQVDRTLAALKDVGTLRIEKGQLGQTPTLHVRLPTDDRTFGALRQRATILVAMHAPAGWASDLAPGSLLGLSGLFDKARDAVGGAAKEGYDKARDAIPDALPKIKIDAGSLLDRELPSFPMPPAPVATDVPALRQVFAPLGPDGPLGKAVQATTHELGTTLGEVGKLKDSVMSIADRLLGVVQLIPYTIPLMLATYVAIQLAVLTLMLTFLAAAAYVTLRRPREAAAAFMLTPVGFVFYCLRAVLIEAVSRCFALHAPQTPAETVADLRRQVDEVKARIGARRATTITTAGA